MLIRKNKTIILGKLGSNKPAVFSLIILILSAVIAILGYIIMPDKTPNANDGNIQIQKQKPGFSVSVLKFHKGISLPDRNFFEILASGKESEYNIVPVHSYRIDNEYVYYKKYSRGGSGREEKFSLIRATLPLYVGRSTMFPDPDASGNYSISGKYVTYLDVNQRIQKISLEEVAKIFKDQNVEKRVYLLGTDVNGRDILSRLIFGFRISLSIGFIAVLISIIVGGIVGGLAGFFGGVVDNFLTWLMTVVWSIPGIILVIAISMALQDKGIWVAFVAVGLTTWVDIARVIRGQIISIKEKRFIEAARSLGINNYRIIFKHIFPNIIGPIIVVISSSFAVAILIEAGLSFLGLGVQPPMPSWGMMVREGYSAIGSEGGLHLILFPSLCISAMVLAFNLLGNGLRDAFDPKNVE